MKHDTIEFKNHIQILTAEGRKFAFDAILH